MIESSIWPKVHAASSHFPIALMLLAALCELLSLLFRHPDMLYRLRFTGTFCLITGSLGSWASIATGLIITQGTMWGEGTLLHHHQFVWPAFLLMSGLAAWRSVTPAEPKPGVRWTQFALILIAAAAMAGGGFWGGEMSFES